MMSRYIECTTLQHCNKERCNEERCNKEICNEEICNEERCNEERCNEERHRNAKRTLASVPTSAFLSLVSFIPGKNYAILLQYNGSQMTK